MTTAGPSPVNQGMDSGHEPIPGKADSIPQQEQAMTDVEAIDARLTKSRRWALTHTVETAGGGIALQSQVPSAVVGALVNLGLICPGSRLLNRAGFAVRTHLLKDETR